MTLRRSTRIITTILMLFAVEARAQQELKVVEVTDGIHMLEGAGGNVGVSAGADGVFLIDDKVAAVTEQVRAAVATISEAPIRFVFNTHWHSDHTGGNEELGDAGAIIVAHDNVRERMSTEQFMAFFDNTVPPSPEAALPVITFSDAVTLHLNGDVIHAFHSEPAHTDGDAVVHFQKANVVHMGDVFFSAGFPFIDLSSGGSIDGVIETSTRVLAFIDNETKVIPGHGPLTDRRGLASYRDMLTSIRTRIQEQVDAGKTVDEVIAARPTAEFDEAWGQGFVKPESFVRMVYESLSEPGS